MTRPRKTRRRRYKTPPQLAPQGGHPVGHKTELRPVRSRRDKEPDQRTDRLERSVHLIAELLRSESFRALPAHLQQVVASHWLAKVGDSAPSVDTQEALELFEQASQSPVKPTLVPVPIPAPVSVVEEPRASEPMLRTIPREEWNWARRFFNVPPKAVVVEPKGDAQ